MNKINPPFDPDDFEHLSKEIKKSLESTNANWRSQIESISKYMQSEEMMSIIEESNRKTFESIKYIQNYFNDIDFESLFNSVSDYSSIESHIRVLKSESVSEILDEYLSLALHSYENDNDLGTLLALYPYIEGVTTEISKLCGAKEKLLFSNNLFDYVSKRLDEYEKDSIKEVRKYWIKGMLDGRNSICHGQIETLPSSKIVFEVFGSAVLITEIYRRKLHTHENE